MMTLIDTDRLGYLEDLAESVDELLYRAREKEFEIEAGDKKSAVLVSILLKKLQESMAYLQRCDQNLNEN